MFKRDNEIGKLKKELEESKKKTEENLAGWKRALADFSNYKKEQDAAQKEFIEFANAELILEILPVMDSFDVAWRAMPRDLEKNPWVVGIGHIKTQLENLLKNRGVEEVGRVGEEFDPEVHEAVERAGDKKPATTENTESSRLHGDKKIATTETLKLNETLKVVGIVQKGYKLHGKLIRPAKVRVTPM
ncbi:MAG: nucleotide exchange factor GrpE [Patescibacteria group bacterium]